MYTVPDAVRYALQQIKDGWVFEEFAQKFLSARFGFAFIPVGGVKDRGIDGLEHTYSRKGFIKQVFQISTELNVEAKIVNTLKKLDENGVKYSNITYVTNRKVNDKDAIINSLQDNHGINLRIFDQEWFVTSVDYNVGTKNAYFTFIDSYLHEFNSPGKSYAVHKMEKDSRLFVFLRQQLDSSWSNAKIDDMLAESLILFALEGTDPDKEIFKTTDQIMDSIREFVKFDPKIIHDSIKKRLVVLSAKAGRKINRYPKEDKYCLPHETRLEISQRNLSDKQLQEDFFEQTTAIVKRFLRENHVNIKDAVELINEVIHRIFYQQGLEFSDFVLHGTSRHTMEKDLQETINLTVDESSVILKNKEQVKVALLMAIRDIVYNGTESQRRYLKSLSNTYMMMFLLQWNPQIALYFESMASKMHIYVCTSILIPAFSEYYLEEQNKRHWTLLEAANAAGITMFISDAIIDELVTHFKMLKSKYDNFYSADEEMYLENELQLLYIEEIMMRAYFHGKARGKVRTFNDFMDNFCSPALNNPKDELIDYLKNKFGITYLPDQKLNVKIDSNEHKRLSDHLNSFKKSATRAKTDAKIILTIYGLRSKNNETANAGIFGYKTWWLSKDTTTYEAVRSVFGDKYPVSCYIRPDFLYNHIALAPKKVEVDELYKKIFPSMLGVNLSFHLPKDVLDFIQKEIHEHSMKDPVRIKAILRQLTERLQSDPSSRTRAYVKSFFDEEFKKELLK
ncbi:MAG: hypothetical protein U0U70_08115 [Chitinophagaceae bacterium]